MKTLLPASESVVNVSCAIPKFLAYAAGITFTLASTVTTITTDLREVAYTVTWTKSGTTTVATTATGSSLNQLSFSGPSAIARTYTRKSTAYFGKYGLNLKL